MRNEHNRSHFKSRFNDTINYSKIVSSKNMHINNSIIGVIIVILDVMAPSTIIATGIIK